MRASKTILFLGFIILSSNFAQAKCLVSVDRIEAVAKKIKWKNENGEPSNTALIQATAMGTIDSDREDQNTSFTYEAFLKPDQDGTFQLLPLPLFVLEMKANRNSIYICAHYDSENEKQTQAVIYFLRYNEIKGVFPKPLPLMGMSHFFWKNLKDTPFIIAALPWGISEFIQGTTIDFISDLTRIGINRIRITSKQIELYSGGDPKQFDHYVFRKTIPFDGVNKRN